MLNIRLVFQSFPFKFCLITPNWSDYPLFDSLGNPKKMAHLKITNGILQEVPPLSSFLYFISLVDVVSVQLAEGDNRNCARGSLTKILFLFLAALGLLRQSNKGGTTEDNNRNFARGYPTELFFIFILFGWLGISSTNWIKQPEFCKGLIHVALFFLSSRLTPESESDLLVLQKIKALLEGGQRIRSKYDTEQVQVLICRRIWIPY